MNNQNPAIRNHTIDTMKAIGIFLVYYGHFVDKLYCKQSQGALVQVKLLGSFIMPLFFFLAGLFFKPQIESITNSLFDKIKKRLLPVAFFSLINLPIVLVTGPLDPLFVFKCYAYGVPVLNTPTWFLISLFLVESTVIILSPLIAPYKNIYFILVASIFFAIGLTLPQYSDHILAEAQLPKQFWYIVLTPLVLGFYFLGYALKKVVALNLRWQINFFIFFLSGFIFLRTFDLNVSLPEIYPVVWFVTSDYGNPFWFMVTALSGIISVIFFS